MSRTTDSSPIDFTGPVTFIADRVKFLDATDNTKVAKLDCSAITAGQESIISIPDTDSTSALLAGTQTFTGDKAFTGALVVPTATSPAQTAEGSLVWDSNDDLLTVGDGASRKTMVDAGSTQAITGTKTFTSSVHTTADINGGTIDAAAIGGATPAAGVFTTLAATSLDTTPIGGVTPAAGAFTTLAASGTSSLAAITGTTIGGTAITASAGFTATPAATDALIGTVNAPASGTTAVTFERFGSFFKLNFTLTAARIPVTDGDVSGSHGSLKLMDMAEGGLLWMGCRQNYTAYTPDGTGVPDDTAFEIGVGTVAIAAAADGTLGATNDDIGADIDQTLSGGTTTGTLHTASNKVFDGTGSAGDIYLNWSGSAATVDGNGTIDCTGTISIVGVLLSDD